ncbi:MAG: biotin--[acetyl-CoA-carboxylase] ligase [Acidobacteriota bacterium]
MTSLEYPALGQLLRDRGKVSQMGRFIVTFDRVGSTNERAVFLARRGAPHGCLVLAREQTAGKGRWQRRWISRLGGLYLSSVLRPSCGEEGAPELLPLACSVAASEAISHASRVSSRVRWPNDLLVQGKKVGGILCEASFSGDKLEFVVAGFGINVNQLPEDFSSGLTETAISLRMATGCEFDELLLAACLVERLEVWWKACSGGADGIRKRWAELAHGEKGMTVMVEAKDGKTFDALTVGLAEDGGLRVRLEDGREQVLYSEDVVYFKPL